MKKINISIVDIITVILVSIIFYCTYKVYVKDYKCILSLKTVENFDNHDGYSETLINQRHQKLDTDLKKFRQLDLPININDYGIKCSNWNNDKLQRFPNGGNSCKLIDADAICLDKNNKQTTCNKIYDLTVRSLSTFDIPGMINSQFRKLKPIFKDIDVDIINKEKEIKNLVEKYIQLKNTNNQQNYFLDSNKTFLQNSETRDRLIKDINEQKNNSFNTNTLNFRQNKDQIIELENTDILLNKLLKWFSVTIIVISIIFLLSRRVD